MTTQAERINIPNIKRLFLVHIELASGTLYFSTKLFKYIYNGSSRLYQPFIEKLISFKDSAGYADQASLNSVVNLLLLNKKYSDAGDYLLTYLESNPVERREIKIYELRLNSWDETFSSDCKVLRFHGIIDQATNITETCFTLACSNLICGLNRKLPFSKLTKEDYSSIDPDDLGKQANIIYGDFSKIPCHAVDAGAASPLSADINASVNSVIPSDASDFPSSGKIGIEEEFITYTGKSGNTLTGCTRGVDATTAATHDKGMVVWEEKTQFVYLVAKHPVHAIGEVYVDDILITSAITKYTGQTGNELAGYAGKAVIKASAKQVFTIRVDLVADDTIDVSDTITVNDGIGVSDTIDVADTITVNDGIGVTDDIGMAAHASYQNNTMYPSSASNNAWIDGNTSTGAYLGTSSSQYATGFFDRDKWLTSHNQYAWIFVDQVVAPSTLYVKIGSTWRNQTTLPNKGWVRFGFGPMNDWEDASVYIYASAVNKIMVYEIYKEVAWEESITHTKTGSASKTGSATKGGSATKSGAATKSGSATKGGAASKTGTVSLSGNSSADIKIGSNFVADVEGYQDDASGTITGTPNALIQRPDHIIEHIWTELLSRDSSEIGSSFATSGTTYASNSWNFAFCLPDISQNLQEIFDFLAMQCKSRLYSVVGKLELVYQEDSPPGGSDSITFAKKDRIGQPVFDKTAIEQVKNKLIGYYNRDFSLQNGYKDSVTVSDATSISKYGTLEFSINFPAIKTSGHTTSILNWLLSEKKDVLWVIEMNAPSPALLLGFEDYFDVSDTNVKDSTDFRIIEKYYDGNQITLRGREW